MVCMQGVKNAVPKTILQLMNVDGMTRENVASHLQKYRLYLKKLGGLTSNAKITPEALQAIQQVLPIKARIIIPCAVVTCAEHVMAVSVTCRYRLGFKPYSRCCTFRPTPDLCHVLVAFTEEFADNHVQTGGIADLVIATCLRNTLCTPIRSYAKISLLCYWCSTWCTNADVLLESACAMAHMCITVCIVVCVCVCVCNCVWPIILVVSMRHPDNSAFTAVWPSSKISSRLSR